MGVGLAGRSGGGVEMATVVAVGAGNVTGCAGGVTGVGEGTGLSSGVETMFSGASAGAGTVSGTVVAEGLPQAAVTTIHGAIRYAAALSRVPIKVF